MASGARRRIKHVSYARFGYYFILPFFLVYFLFSLYPLMNTFKFSVYKNTAQEVNHYAPEYVGLDNFKALLIEPSEGDDNYFRAKGVYTEFTDAVKNTMKIWLVNFIPQIVFSLLLAVWFSDAKLKIKGKGFFKVVMYMPNIITAASVAALALRLFGDTELSVINGLLMRWGVVDEPILFLTTDATKRLIISGVQAWMWFGNTMILLIAGIAGINPSLYEAANIDGANSSQVFFKITLPLLRPILVFTLITSMIGGLQMYDIPYLMNTGTVLSRGTRTIAIFIYTYYMGALPQDTGHAGAASVILFVLTSILGAIVFYLNRDVDEIAQRKKVRQLKKQAKLAAKNKAYGGFGL